MLGRSGRHGKAERSPENKCVLICSEPLTSQEQPVVSKAAALMDRKVSA